MDGDEVDATGGAQDTQDAGATCACARVEKRAGEVE